MGNGCVKTKYMGTIKITQYTDIEGWFDFQNIYDEAVRSFPSGSIFVEIGTYLGRSAAYMGQAIKDSGKDILFYTIDTFESDAVLPDKPIDSMQRFKLAMSDLGLNDYVFSLVGRSVDVKHSFGSQQIAFLFIDGAHDYGTVKSEIQTYLPKMQPNGILAGHDYDFHEVYKAVNETLCGYEIQSIGGSWLVKLDKEI